MALPNLCDLAYQAMEWNLPFFLNLMKMLTGFLVVLTDLLSALEEFSLSVSSQITSAPPEGGWCETR